MLRKDDIFDDLNGVSYIVIDALKPGGMGATFIVEELVTTSKICSQDASLENH